MAEIPRTASENFDSIFDRNRQSDLYQHREVEAVYGTNPQDGLPTPVTSESPYHTKAALLHPATFVCMADQSAFVLRSALGAELARFLPAETQRRANGDYTVNGLLMLWRLVWTRQATLWIWIAKCAQLIWSLVSSRQYRLVVEPLRKQCKHYARQKSDMPADRDSKYMDRLCMAQRSETGEYISLRDSAMFACELRFPRDVRSEAELEEWDSALLAEAERQRNEKPFDLEAEMTASKETQK